MRYSASSMAASLIVVAVYVSMAGIGCLRLISKLYKAEEKQNTLNEELEKANRDQREQLQRITALNETLKEEEDIIQAAGHGIWKCPIDSDGRVCGMIGNKQWKTIFGTENMDMTPEEELLYFVGRLVNQSEDPRNFGFDDMKPDEIIHLTFAWNHPIKGVIYVEMASAMHTMSDGTLQVSGYAADVTEQTISEQKWEEELLRAREKAEASSEAKTQFLFNMSHDIRTPMNAIIGFTDLLEKHLDDREQAMNYISKIKYSNEFLLSLINNVLEMARIESGKETLDETRCNVYDFNDSLNAVFASQMKEKGLNFDMSAQVEHPDVLGDTTKVKEIFLNILSNALKYTPEGGSVTFRTTELPSDREGYALYQTVIADTGIGMSKEFLPHLFEEFSRERNTTESKIVGTGLGMPIVKNLVGLMNGTIEVESEPGRGTTFTITIPHRIVTDIAEEEEKSALTSAVDFRGKRILLAEDNDLNAEIAMEFLHEAGFAVERAADGIICVDMLQKAPEGYYDLILMDIQMPNMDGYKATRVIRDIKDSSRSNIPILAMTANAFEEDRRNALAAGMNGHLSKPIKLQTLMETLTEILK